MNKEISKIIAITLMLVLNYAGLSAVGTTLASFSDTETSDENEFRAGTLDISLDDVGAYSSSFMYPGDATTTAISLSYLGSVNSQYTASTTLSGTDITACDYITMTVATTTTVYYTGLIKDFISATSTTVDTTWNFTFTVANDAPSSVWGKTCSFAWTYTAWQDNLLDSSFGFTAIKEKLGAIRIGKAVVLNEIYPAPSSGSPTPPNDREWVELYNSSASSIDVLDWRISELSGGNGAEQMYTISTTCSAPSASKVVPYDGASTIIAPGGLLVVEFCTGSNVLNNPGDTVRLYDPASVLFVDAHTYPPTVNGKSHQRIPNGGIWIDPDPTPGETNRVSMQDLTDAGLDEETIAQIIALLAEKGETLLEEESTVLNSFTPIPDSFTLVAESTQSSSVEEIPEEEVTTETEPAIESETIEEVVETVITADPNIEPETIEKTIVEAVVEAVPDDGLIWTDAVEETPAVVAEPEVLPVSEEVIE